MGGFFFWIVQGNGLVMVASGVKGGSGFGMLRVFGIIGKLYLQPPEREYDCRWWLVLMECWEEFAMALIMKRSWVWVCRMGNWGM